MAWGGGGAILSCSILLTAEVADISTILKSFSSEVLCAFHVPHQVAGKLCKNHHHHHHQKEERKQEDAQNLGFSQTHTNAHGVLVQTFFRATTRSTKVLKAQKISVKSPLSPPPRTGCTGGSF